MYSLDSFSVGDVKMLIDCYVHCTMYMLVVSCFLSFCFDFTFAIIFCTCTLFMISQ